ncbi:inositol 1,4,5-triphosphate receptor associated 2 isoform X2 [Scyliorhinus canicula]|uniref:inositol 1,4,5-triphosphate receptor associated 2 isoform X2 n=1 Tax=Scyliorhinus canicula TaxID=7830 RepID=UPI0018F3747E|nr:inositol 1,4,5-triphosphate receptor associated 2 isoform X2 [Scyliorhinus canicula]
MTSKRHNPVDSICRKIQTIQRRDRVSNPVLKIPKFRSRNFESPQISLKKNMEVILRNRKVDNHTVQQEVNIAVANCTSSPETSGQQRNARGRPALVSSTYTVVSSIGEKVTKPLHGCRAPSSSTPVNESERNVAILSQPHSAIINIEHRILASNDYSAACSPVNTTNFNFYTHLHRTQSPVAKRLSLDETSVYEPAVPNRMENAEHTSLICEEDLLDTIFYACDIKHRGKVAVSMIVDYLRHTTSRSSDDSGLEDLCNMLDPDNKDISIDLTTYRAVMKEWIEDCRRESIHEKTQEAVNVEEDVAQLCDGLISGTKFSDGTVGSLEAFGGEISKGDLETSDLISSIADLQYNHQKLQEQNRKLRLAVDATEESNNRLMEENEELHSQVKSVHQSILIEKSLKEDLEDLKTQLCTLQESNKRLLLQNKQEAKENQSLIQTIASLQEENFKNAIDIESLQGRISVLSNDKTELQVQLTELDNLVHSKDAVLHERNNHIEELKSSIVEYSMVVEALRMEKIKLENQLVVQQELASEYINLPAIPPDGPDQTSAPSSLQSELLNAQNVFEINGSEWSRASEHNTLTFDETLDKEVLMLMQSPGTEEATVQFKMITAQMTKELSEEIEALVTWFRQIGELKINCRDLNDAKLENLKDNLQERRQLWLQSLCALEEQRLAADKEYIRLASNLRRCKTERLHLKRKEANRLHELEAQKQLTETAAASFELQLHQVCQQLGDLQKEICNKDAALVSVRKVTEVLQHELEEAVIARQNLQSINQALSGTTKTLEQKLNQRQTTIQSLREEIFQQKLCGLQSQTRGCCKELWPEVVQCEEQSQAPQNSLPCIQQWKSHKSITTYTCTPLLDALMLECFYPVSGFQNCSGFYSNSNTIEHRKPMTSANDELLGGQFRCELHTVDIQAEEAFSVPGMSGERLDKAAAGKEVDSHDLLQPSETLEHSQLNIPCIITTESSDMSGSGAPHTSTKQPDNGLQLQERIKTLDGDGEKNANVCGIIEDGTSGGPAPMDASQLISKLCNAKEDQPGSRTKVKINLEATRGSVAVDELSSSELHVVHGSPVRSVAGTSDSKIPDLLNLQSASATEQEVEAEFLRFSLAFKCDMFTLDKRLRLEERSRDLAETNLKKEIEKCQHTLQTVKPLCEEEQSLEAFEKLEKSLAMLMQTISRVASRAEMLGAIHQETRVSKAVEVMIQYVENLKCMYVKEHTELEEMKQLLLQNGKASSSFGENRDELRSKKFLTPQTFGKSSPRRVSIAAIPRSTGGSPFDLSKLKEMDEGRRRSEGDQDKFRNKLTRKMSTWKFLGQKENDPSLSRPTLHRFISTCTWGDKDNQPVNKGNVPALESQEEEEKEEETEEAILTEADNCSDAETCVVYRGISDHLAKLWAAFSKSDRGPWLPVILLFSLSILGSFLIGWSFHTSVDAASVPTGVTWQAIRQFLWPYTELRHNGQPPV